VSLNTSFLRKISHQHDKTCYDQPLANFEVRIFIRYGNTNGNAKCINRVDFCGQGHSRSSAMSSFDRAHTISYSTLIETMCLSCAVIEL